jgi:PAS domain S-box-containing protein
VTGEVPGPDPDEIDIRDQLRDMLRQLEYDRLVTAARLQALVDSMRVGVILQDADQTVLIANEAATTVLGLAVGPVELTGLAGPELVALRRRPPEHYAELDRLAAAWIRAQEPLRGREVPIGPELTIEVDLVPIATDERGHGQLWVLRDVTEQVQARQALVRRNEELSRLAGLKTEFLSLVSHELRTPLTALTGVTALLADTGDEDGRVLAGAVLRNVQRLTALVETLLLLAGLESHSRPLQVVTTDVDGLLRDALAAAAPLAESYLVDLRVSGRDDAGTELPGDAGLIARMLQLVIAAAIGVSAPESKVDVCSWTDHAAGRWVVEVTDENELTVGAGRMFTTVPRSPRGTDPLIGSGLGLALARAISERHGGAVYLLASDDGGTTVRVELALAGPPP